MSRLTSLESRVELRLAMEKFLAKHCTGMDDHDDTNCQKCAEMRDEFIAIVNAWVLVWNKQ